MMKIQNRQRLLYAFLTMGLFVLLALGLAAGRADAAGNTGWVQDGGAWYYYDSTGTAVTGWQKIGGTWYYMDGTGVMHTGRLTLGSTQYYLQSNGAMASGWQKLDNAWYYFGSDGAMRTGWQQIGGTWYYLDSSGVMQTGWLTLGSTKYYLQSGGAMASGWQKLDNAWYYFGSDGAMRTGWQKVGSTWYYLDSSGVMQTGWLTLGSTKYYLQSNGAMASYWQWIDDAWYYFGSDGAMRTGWVQYNSGWYFLDENGQMASMAWINDTYYVNGSGKWISNSSSAAERNAAAAEIAKDIAQYILADKNLTTDLDRVEAAAQIVYYFFLNDEYTMSGSIYNTAYGVFIGGQASCSGATRALGLVLTYMGFSWTHVNENQYTHQWCRLYMDGRIGWADAGSGMAGYGDFALAGLYGL